MKRIGTILLAGIMLFALAACGSQTSDNPTSTPPSTNTEKTIEPSPSESETPQNEDSEDSATNNGDSKILVAYFSSAGNIDTSKTAQGNIGKGNTIKIAELISEQIDGELFFIETEEKYSSNYREAIDVALQEQRNDTRPALASHVENMEDYDVIFIGYPNWWGTIPMAIATFLEEYDFSGKTIVPFCTYEDSGLGRSESDIAKLCPDATILKALGIRERNIDNAKNDVETWLKELELK